MPGLPVEPGQEARIGRVLRAEHLDRDITAQHLIPGPPHRRHAAGAQDLPQHVPAAKNPGAGHRHDSAPGQPAARSAPDRARDRELPGPGTAAGSVLPSAATTAAATSLIARNISKPPGRGSVFRPAASDQARALVAAADADGGPQALRVDEACAADVADLGADAGHRVLRVTRRARKAKVPLTPATAATLDTYLKDRAHRAGRGSPAQLTGPLLATATGGRLRQGHLWELVRRLARTTGIETWQELSPHSLRHSAIAFALDAGATLRDVQDYAGHKDPRTTRRQNTPGTAWTATPPTR